MNRALLPPPRIPELICMLIIISVMGKGPITAKLAAQSCFWLTRVHTSPAPLCLKQSCALFQLVLASFRKGLTIWCNLGLENFLKDQF